MQEPRNRPNKFAWIIIVVVSALITLCVCFVFLFLKLFGLNNGSTIANISYDIFTTIFVIAQFFFVYFQWFAAKQLQQSRQVTNASSTSRIPQGILGVPPPTNPISILQRENIVKDVYTKLVQPSTRAVVLTGIVGCGKSYTAALVREYVEKQRFDNQGPYTGESIWLEIDQNTVINDIAVSLFNELDKPVPDLENLSTQNQAAVLFNALNDANEARLIILDQFDKLLDAQTGYIYANRPGMGEWLDAILTQHCGCRFLLTSRLWPRGPHGYDIANENEYSIEKLSDDEAKQLLRRQSDNRVSQAKPEELDRILVYCDNHPLALTLVASRLRVHHLELSTFLRDSAHIKRWIEDLASNGLDGGLNELYETQLTPLQQKLLLAFSIFRKPVLREAAATIFRLQIAPGQLLSNCDVLVRLHLLQASKMYQDHYQLHPIVSAYSRYQFDRSNEEANEVFLQEAHAEAARYYLQQAKHPTVQKELGLGVTLQQFYKVEAIWHQCQSRQQQKAYTLLELENIFPKDLRKQQENMILLDLYQQLLPSENWDPKPMESLHIYDNLGEVCQALGKTQEALNYYNEVLALARDLKDYNKEQRTREIIAELSQRLNR